MDRGGKASQGQSAFVKKDSPQTSLKNILDSWSMHELPIPSVKILAEDPYKCAVRVVCPYLHGYNYPAYRSILRDEYVEDIAQYTIVETHKPAAI
jgi:hypothetical protein